MFANTVNRFSFRMGLPRVVKAQPKAETFIQADGLELCMECWKEYMHSDERKNAASMMKLSSGSNDPSNGYESDPYGDQRKADLKIGEAANAMVNSLSRIHIWAIYKGYSMGNVWNFPHADYPSTLIEAKIELEKKLRNNIATAVKF